MTQHRIRQLVRDNAGTFVALTITSMATLRVLAITDGQPREAAYLVTAAGPSALLASVMTSLVPSGLTIITIGSWFLAPARQRRIRVAITLASLTVVLVATTTVLNFIGLSALCLLSLTLLRRTPPIRSFDEFERTIPSRAVGRLQMVVGTYAVFLAMVVAGTIVSSTPWIPPERIQPSTSEPAFTGYVLNDDGKRLLVLKDDPRYITAIDGSSATRELCRRKEFGVPLPTWLAESVPGLVRGGSARRSPCP